jgi:hypothetical protein
MSKLQVIEKPKTELEKMVVKTRKRMESRFQSKPKVIEFILNVEKAWERYSVNRDFTELYRLFVPVVKAKAQLCARKWESCGVSAEDFESIFWEETWRICENYRWTSDFYLSETIYESFKKREIDVVRKVTGGGKLGHSVSLNEQDHIGGNVEKEVTDKLLIEQMLEEALLTEKEKQFLAAWYENPEGTLQELARSSGHKHAMEAKRIQARLRRKLEMYRPEEYTQVVKLDVAVA